MRPSSLHPLTPTSLPFASLPRPAPQTLVFRVLNTFVDDVFAFGMVKMPILHRLATLRDDVIFVVWLIQLKMYGMDKSRPNEYGQVVDAEARSKKAKEEEGGEGKAIEQAKEGDAAESSAVSKGEDAGVRKRQTEGQDAAVE